MFVRTIEYGISPIPRVEERYDYWIDFRRFDAWLASGDYRWSTTIRPEWLKAVCGYRVQIFFRFALHRHVSLARLGLAHAGFNSATICSILEPLNDLRERSPQSTERYYDSWCNLLTHFSIKWPTMARIVRSRPVRFPTADNEYLDFALLTVPDAHEEQSLAGVNQLTMHFGFATLPGKSLILTLTRRQYQYQDEYPLRQENVQLINIG